MPCPNGDRVGIIAGESHAKNSKPARTKRRENMLTVLLDRATEYMPLLFQ
jgi:hypothetical protein